MTQKIHLDALAGIAGDMFVGAMLDAYPHWSNDVISTIRSVLPKVDIVLEHRPHNDGVLTGSRFIVEMHEKESHEHHAHHHDHRHWRDIKNLIQSADIDDAIRKHALGIFHILAEMEAECHGVPIADVSFHEVGAWDSIADIVAAACLIHCLGPTDWSVSDLPRGSGSVNTAHGQLPVPAPAVVKLLDGFKLFDDGIKGERITPTGAAILRYLSPSQKADRQSMTLVGSGLGFGTKTFPGICNGLRILTFVDTTVLGEDLPYEQDKVLCLAFEVDDQSPEDFAVGLDHIRSITGVLDVMHVTGIGKKGRLTFSVQVLVKLNAKDAAITACFTQTTTLGIRMLVQDRMILHREFVQSPQGYQVKLSHRPLGPTGKTEIADVENLVGGADMRQLRRDEAVNSVLKCHKGDQGRE